MGNRVFPAINCVLFNLLRTAYTINVKVQAIRDTSDVIKKKTFFNNVVPGLIIQTFSCYKYVLKYY